ncbi:MAG: hypothetical protein CFK49_10665 [Armatimonadetes bacterium JP3_11]|jgi:CRISPR/Cas system CSM-associated protein Csm3 (group 7 of RAMP superfamily)|nr:MAG: hypothetical protein CFK49_10665 [Armatimonadetes bacterium JP3_11]RMH06615.1 MAG: hypothetical protein D6697_10230 [Armatimonadota bacterium]
MYDEKPYDFVGFPKQTPLRDEGVGQDRIRCELLTGTLELTMETLTPVHVGSGYSDFVKAGQNEYLAALQASKHVREDNTVQRRYIIPGSSFKGAVRSIVEAITCSCVRVIQGKHRPYLPQGYGECISIDKLCPACRMFGAQDYQAHVSFEDAVAPKGSLVLLGTPLLWTPARGGQGLPRRYLDSRGNAKGRKFYSHAKPAQGADPRTCIKTGAIIQNWRVHFLNLTEAELGVLLTALGLHPKYPFPIKVGGGKPVGLGSVRLQLEAMQLIQGENAIRQTGRLGQSQRLQGEALQERVRRLTAQAQSLLDEKSLQEIADILAEGGLQNTAPADPY